MPTIQKRVNLTIDGETYGVLEWLAQKRAKSISSLSLSLIKEALELQEDLYFSRVAEERLARKEERIPHQKAWE